MTESQHRAASTVDVAGIGFGPSNLAVAIALEDCNSVVSGSGRLTAEFFERQPAFGWHRGMLIEGTTMQVSFLKDLATMRNPQSRYTFISYLHDRGRLPDFINCRTIFPSRIEFHDYLEWVAGCFSEAVRYGVEVTDLLPVVDDGAITHLDVVGRRLDGSGRTLVRRAANVVLGAGISPCLPSGVAPSERVFHTAQLMDRVDGLAESRPRRILVVGAGQSAAEAAEYLHRRCAGAEICVVFARYGFSAADDNAFANRIFDPEAVDVVFGAGDDVRGRLLDYHGNTNYSVVDVDLCQSLFRLHYEERVRGGVSRLRIMNTSVIRSVEEDARGLRVDLEHLPTGEVRTVEADAAVFATGYRPSDPLPLLGRIASQCKQDGANRPVLERDYRVVTSSAVTCGIYLHGAVAEPTHGISAGLLSTTAVRSGEIVRSLQKRAHRVAPGDS